MKKKSVISVVVFCFVFMVIMTSCVPPVNNNLGWGGTNDGPGVTVPDPDLARLVIPLPTVNPRARGVGLGSAMYHTNYFEVFFRRTDIEPNAFHSASATAEDGEIVVEIPVGVYDILLIAGSRFGNNRLAMASSYVLGRAIVLGQNQIRMQLAAFDMNIIAPDTVNVTDAFSVSVEIYTKNPMIELSFVTLFSFSDYFITLHAGHYFQGEWVANKPNLFTGSTSMTAPLAPIETSLTLIGSNFRPLDNQHFSLWAIIPVRGTVWLPQDILSNFSRPINFVRGQVIPEVEIEIIWPDL